MKEPKTVTVDGVEYYFDTDGEDRGNDCRECAANLNEPDGLCKRLPRCRGGVWKLKEATR